MRRDPEVPRIEKQIADYRKVLKRRYPTPRHDPFEGVPMVDAYTTFFEKK